MALFNNQEKEMKRQFKAQIDAQNTSIEANVTQQMADQAHAVYDPQVSAMLLENKMKMLNWNENFDRGVLELNQEDNGLIEPFGAEQLAFLNDKRGEKGFCSSSAQTLRAIKLHMAKYGTEDRSKRLFNDIAGAYQVTILLSRADGKPQQLAKSQIIRTSGEFIRGNENNKNTKLFGLF